MNKFYKKEELPSIVLCLFIKSHLKLQMSFLSDKRRFSYGRKYHKYLEEFRKCMEHILS